MEGMSVGPWQPPIPSLASLPVDQSKTDPKPAYYKLQFGDDYTGFSYYVRTLAVMIGRNVEKPISPPPPAITSPQVPSIPPIEDGLQDGSGQGGMDVKPILEDGQDLHDQIHLHDDSRILRTPPVPGLNTPPPSVVPEESQKQDSDQDHPAATSMQMEVTRSIDDIVPGDGTPEVDENVLKMFEMPQEPQESQEAGPSQQNPEQGVSEEDGGDIKMDDTQNSGMADVNLENDQNGEDVQQSQQADMTMFESRESQDQDSAQAQEMADVPMQVEGDFQDVKVEEFEELQDQGPAPPPPPSKSSAPVEHVDVDLGPLKSVSRNHAKIEYRSDLGYFCLDIYGRNGAWVDDRYYVKGSTVLLHQGSQIQIATRIFSFILPPSPGGSPYGLETSYDPNAFEDLPYPYNLPPDEVGYAEFYGEGGGPGPSTAAAIQARALQEAAANAPMPEFKPFNAFAAADGHGLGFEMDERWLRDWDESGEEDDSEDDDSSDDSESDDDDDDDEGDSYDSSYESDPQDERVGKVNPYLEDGGSDEDDDDDDEEEGDEEEEYKVPPKKPQKIRLKIKRRRVDSDLSSLEDSGDAQMTTASPSLAPSTKQHTPEPIPQAAKKPKKLSKKAIAAAAAAARREAEAAAKAAERKEEEGMQVDGVPKPKGGGKASKTPKKKALAKAPSEVPSMDVDIKPEMVPEGSVATLGEVVDTAVATTAVQTAPKPKKKKAEPKKKATKVEGQTAGAVAGAALPPNGTIPIAKSEPAADLPMTLASVAATLPPAILKPQSKPMNVPETPQSVPPAQAPQIAPKAVQVQSVPTASAAVPPVIPQPTPPLITSNVKPPETPAAVPPTIQTVAQNSSSATPEPSRPFFVTELNETPGRPGHIIVNVPIPPSGAGPRPPPGPLIGLDGLPFIGPPPIKPIATFATIIYTSLAHLPRGRGTLGEVCNWVAGEWEWFRLNVDAGWQNSIRHNLSLNKAFLKVPRIPEDDPEFKGSVWILDPEEGPLFEEKQKKELAKAIGDKSGKAPDIKTARDRQKIEERIQRQREEAIAAREAQIAAQTKARAIAQAQAQAQAQRANLQRQQLANGGVGPGVSPRPPHGQIHGRAPLPNQLHQHQRPPPQRAQPPIPPKPAPIAKVPVNIILSTITPSLRAKNQITTLDAYNKPLPFVFDGRILVLDPVVFSHLTPELISGLEKLSAGPAIGVLAQWVNGKEKSRQAAAKNAAAAGASGIKNGTTATNTMPNARPVNGTQVRPLQPGRAPIRPTVRPQPGNTAQPGTRPPISARPPAPNQVNPAVRPPQQAVRPPAQINTPAGTGASGSAASVRPPAPTAAQNATISPRPVAATPSPRPPAATPSPRPPAATPAPSITAAPTATTTSTTTPSNNTNTSTPKPASNPTAKTPVPQKIHKIIAQIASAARERRDVKSIGPNAQQLLDYLKIVGTTLDVKMAEKIWETGIMPPDIAARVSALGKGGVRTNGTVAKGGTATPGSIKSPTPGVAAVKPAGTSIQQGQIPVGAQVVANRANGQAATAMPTVTAAAAAAAGDAVGSKRKLEDSQSPVVETEAKKAKMEATHPAAATA